MHTHYPSSRLLQAYCLLLKVRTLLYQYLASVASNATWWLPYMAGNFPTNIWLRSLIIFWSHVDQFLSNYQVLFRLLSASVRRLSMLISKYYKSHESVISYKTIILTQSDSVDQWLPMSHFSRLPILLDPHVYKGPLCQPVLADLVYCNFPCEYRTINPYLRASALVSASFLCTLRSSIRVSYSICLRFRQLCTKVNCITLNVTRVDSTAQVVYVVP